MKAIKNNIEQQIRQQIEKREIAPSRDLWSEIESQATVTSSKPSFNWLLIAACLVLTFSLGMVLFFNQENKQAAASENRAQTVTEPAVREPSEPVAKVRHTESIAESHGQDTAAENSSAGIKTEVQKQETQTFTRQDEMPVVRQNSAQLISELSPIKPEKTIAQADSVKVPVKKKRYVDPSTLLFSVEHREVIEKTKGKSNVATIDLNGN
jgi:hypothetical protein